MLEQYPDDVKLVFKSFPLERIHKSAKGAAISALAAHQQGKFWEYHSKLFQNSNNLNTEKLNEIARVVGLDMELFKKDTENPGLAALVQRDLKDGIEAGVRGTPTIFINGRMLEQRSLSGFKQIIDDELAEIQKGG